MNFKKFGAMAVMLAVTVGVLAGSIVSARADAGTPGYTPGLTIYANKCSPTSVYSAKVDEMTDPYAGGILWRFAFLTKGATQNMEVWVIIKFDENDPSTWRYWNCSTPASPNNKYCYSLSSTPVPALSGTLTSNTTVHCLMPTLLEFQTFGFPDQVCFVFDNTVNGVVNLNCIAVANL